MIIPVYNCEEYIQRCLDSVFQQTFQDFEIILINDGSTDGGLAILRQNAKEHSEITLIDQENHGQGYARNRAIERAKGEYILFVDADDFIEPLTLELTLARAEQDNSDLVHFDWKLSTSSDIRPESLKYYNVEPFVHKDLLEGAECDELMRMNNYFSVNNLYRKRFLDEKNIRYDEGFIYEDNSFVMAVANRAKKISLIHSPLYIVQKNLSSTTQSHTDTDRHYRAHIRAIRKSFEELRPRTPYSAFYLAGYYLEKVVVYYERRVPARYRGAYIKEFVDILAAQKLLIPKDHSGNRFLQLCIKHGIFANKRYAAFRLLIVYKLRLLPGGKKVLSRARRLKHSIVYPPGKYQNELKKPLIKDSIVFLGFDERYTGNSRYLFEEIIHDKRFTKRTIKFLSDDELIPEKYRLVPRTDDAAVWLARAEVVIAETWVSDSIIKREGSVVIQLWHGTPLKKVLFDSSEASLMKKNDRYKVAKHRSIMRWDYLLADSAAAAKKLQSSFLFPRDRILVAGYPRVKYLIKNKDNTDLRQKIKESIGIAQSLQNKKIVLYAPTWRDYNYGKSVEVQDYSYVVDLNKLAERLGDDYLVLYHDHHFLSQMPGTLHKNCIDVGGYETQDLLLIADCLITDYSSILFDAFSIQTPVILYVNDFERYEKARGVHRDIWDELQPFIAKDNESLVKMIENYKVTKSYLAIGEKYCYKSDVSLVDFIKELDVEDAN